jgi:uncharacterized RDD family membrane protein YckC
MDEFFVKDGEEEKGPFTFEELTDGRLEPDDLVRTNFGKWEKASDVLDFAEYFQYEGYSFPTQANLAGVGRRILAFFIDHFVISIMVITGCYTFNQYLPFSMANFDLENAQHREIMQAIFSVVFFTYNFLFEASPLSATLGQFLCKLIIVDADGKKLTILKALIRSAGKFLSFGFMFIGFIGVFFSQYRQAFHDAIARTYVVNKDLIGVAVEEEDATDELI